MNAQQRKLITGGLSKPSKMPGYSYNLPAIHCKTGSKLAQIPGTTCHGCYALKGRYRFPNVMDAMMRRLGSITRPDWARLPTSTPASLAGSAGMTPGTYKA